MKRIYVAGAYSADNVMDVFGNMRRGMDAATAILMMGAAPYCPWLDHDLALRADISVQNFYDCSMAWLEVSDAVFLVKERYETSKGVAKELAYAREHNIPIFTSLPVLLEWLRRIKLSATMKGRRE